MARRSASGRALWAIAFIVAYGLAWRSTQNLTLLDSGFSAWFPPAGLAFSYLLLVGPTGAVEVFAARIASTALFVSDAWRDEPEGVITRAIAITACYTLGAWFLRRGRLRFTGVRELGWFTVVGVVAVPFGAALSVAAVSVLLLDGVAADAFDAARTVWIGDAIAIATLVPGALLVNAVLVGRFRAPRWPNRRPERIELALQVLALVLGPVLALAVAHDQDATGFLSLAVLPVLWVALRGDVLLAAVGLCVVNTSLTVAASGWLGATTRMSELQAVMLAAALVALYVAAVTQTERQLVAELRVSEARYRTLIDNVPSLVVRFDTAGQVKFVNSPDWFDSTLGIDEIVSHLREEWPTITTAMSSMGQVERSWEITEDDGEVRWFSGRLRREHSVEGDPVGVMALITDETPSLRAEAELARVRWSDPLTELMNRDRFLDLLEPLAARVAPGVLGVAVLDIDGFKRINETVGHGAADSALIEVARRLSERVGDTGFAARLTGDEFAVAVPVAGAEDAAALGEELVREMRLRVPVDDHELPITCSVGVAWGDSARDAVSVLYDAESALHSSKESGGDRSSTFQTGLRLAKVDRERRLALIHRALDANDVVVHYQPIFELESGAIAGVEALVRLRDRGRLLMPGSFMDLVEEQGLDDRLDGAVLEQTLHDLARWREMAGGRHLYAAVNVTARHLVQPGFVRQVLAACTRHGVPPENLRVELTETMVMADLEAAVRALTSLREHGVKAAIDDFGIGYSSMAYLQQLPVDVLKIDRSFVAGLPGDDDDRSIVGLVVGLAQALGLSVTAEGIETDAQRVELIELGCRMGQGFLLARPEEAAAFEARLVSIATA